MPVIISDNKTFAKQAGYKGIRLLIYRVNINVGYAKAYMRLFITLLFKKCYYGPFKGEFGHFLAHTLPFLMYLHSKRVKIIYCGMEIHKPLLVDDERRSIIYDFRPLRDFFDEYSPKSNSTVTPPDVTTEIERFKNEAKKSFFPFWNIDDDFYYWFIHRNWLLKGHTFVYHLEKAYKTKDENSVCIFPRTKGSEYTDNHGARWNYQELIEKVSPYFDKIYLCGHPSQCESLTVSGKVELCVSSDNSIMMEKCSNSKLIITPHSGINNIGEYTNTKVLIIYKGGNKMDDIGSIHNTLRFRPSIGTRHTLTFAFSMDGVVDLVREFTGTNHK